MLNGEQQANVESPEQSLKLRMLALLEFLKRKSNLVGRSLEEVNF